MRDRSGDRIRHGNLVGDIGRQRERGGAVRQPVYVGRCGVEIAGAACQERDVGAMPRQQAGGRATDAPTRAGD